MKYQGILICHFYSTLCFHLCSRLLTDDVNTKRFVPDIWTSKWDLLKILDSLYHGALPCKLTCLWQNISSNNQICIWPRGFIKSRIMRDNMSINTLRHCVRDLDNTIWHGQIRKKILAHFNAIHDYLCHFLLLFYVERTFDEMVKHKLRPVL